MQKTFSMRRKSECENDSFVQGTVGERVGFVWPLTLEVVSLSRKFDAERRLQRNVTRIIRRKG